jgi:TetR/AcrR family transcriptional repressor of nem operon
MPAASETTTKDRILDVAQQLVQARGFSGFSYADIAAKVGIRKASIHHHFATKGVLGAELMARYRTDFGRALQSIEKSGGGSRSKLRKYGRLFVDVLRDGHRMCLCGMLAADFDALPKSVRTEVSGFFDDNETWLTRVLETGRAEGDLSFTGPVEVQAQVILAALEGAMLVARSYRNVKLFEAVAQRVLAGVGA